MTENEQKILINPYIIGTYSIKFRKKIIFFSQRYERTHDTINYTNVHSFMTHDSFILNLLPVENR